MPRELAMGTGNRVFLRADVQRFLKQRTGLRDIPSATFVNRKVALRGAFCSTLRNPLNYGELALPD